MVPLNRDTYKIGNLYRYYRDANNINDRYQVVEAPGGEDYPSSFMMLRVSGDKDSRPETPFPYSPHDFDTTMILIKETESEELMAFKTLFIQALSLGEMDSLTDLMVELEI